MSEKEQAKLKQEIVEGLYAKNNRKPDGTMFPFRRTFPMFQKNYDDSGEVVMAILRIWKLI